MGFLRDIRNLQEQADATAPEHLARAMPDGVAQATALTGETAAERERARYLAAHGRLGTATIAAVRDTGMTVDDAPVVELDLSVSVAGGPPYGVTHRQPLSRLAASSLRPGASLPVRVDPVDPGSLMIG